MKILPLLAASLFFTLLSSSTFAASYRCVGMDGEGTKINVIYDEETSSLNVNGQILKVESGTEGDNGIATENFKGESGRELYYSLVVEDKSKIILRQFTAADDKEVAVVPLACN